MENASKSNPDTGLLPCLPDRCRRHFFARIHKATGKSPPQRIMAPFYQEEAAVPLHEDIYGRMRTTGEVWDHGTPGGTGAAGAKQVIVGGYIPEWA